MNLSFAWDPPAESAWFEDHSPIVLFGAGILGREVAKRLRDIGRTPAAFIDETPGKAGTTLDQIPVAGLRDGVETFGESAIFVVTIWNPVHRFVATRDRLHQSGVRRVASFLHAAFAFPDHFLPHYAFDLPAATLDQADDVRRALAVFEDDQSRTEFIAHLRFRFTLDFDALPAASSEKYFRSEFADALTPDTVFIDCGAFNGDTVAEFVRATGGAFRSIVAIEPQHENVATLRTTIAADPSLGSRCSVVQAAVAATTGRARFNVVAGEGSHLSDAGGSEVSTVALDDVTRGLASPLFIKFDVEGAELTVLCVATNTLQRRPRLVLAVSAYHRPDDLWRIPLLLHERGGYRIYLRTEGDDGMGIVCYGLPRDQEVRT